MAATTRWQQECCRRITGDDNVDHDIGLDGGDEDGCSRDRGILMQRRGGDFSLMGGGALVSAASSSAASSEPVYYGEAVSNSYLNLEYFTTNS